MENVCRMLKIKNRNGGATACNCPFRNGRSGSTGSSRPSVPGDHVNVGNPPKPVLNAREARGHLEIFVADEVLGRDSVKRRLHRAGGDFERLQEKRADAHRHRQRDQQHLHVFAPAGIGIRRQPSGGDLLQPPHFRPQLLFVPPVGDGAGQFQQRALDQLVGCRREQIPLRVEQPAHVVAQARTRPGAPWKTASESCKLRITNYELRINWPAERNRPGP